MLEFILNHNAFLIKLLEVIAAATGIYFLKKHKRNSATVYFVYFLVYIVVFESLSSYVNYVRVDRPLSFLIGTKIEKNYWLTTLFWDVGAVSFFSFYFYKVLQKPSYKKMVRFLGVVYTIFSVLYILLHQDLFFAHFLIVLNLLGALVVLLCCALYFIELLLSETILRFYYAFEFYAATVIFIWWVVTTPLAFFDVYYTYEVGEHYRDREFVFVRFLIFLFVNILMYLTYTFAFIWCQPNKTN